MYNKKEEEEEEEEEVMMSKCTHTCIHSKNYKGENDNTEN